MTLRAVERPGHRCTTRHAQAIYPFVNADGLGGRGVFVGRDSTGGAFCFDPWVLYAEAVLDDPNAIVLGKLGQGKSSLVKTLLWRMMLFGRRAFVLDVKREYGPLCRAVGVRPISLVPGGSVRLNPLASRPEEHAQLELLRAVTVTALGGPLTQLEAGGLREALRVVRARGSGEPTLPEIAEVLFSPVAEMAQRLQTTAGRTRPGRSPGRAGAPGSLRGPAAGDVRWAHDAGLGARRAAVGAGPARGPRFTGGRDPDGMCDRLDQRVAGADRGAPGPGAADQRRRRKSGRSSSTPGSASGFSPTSSSRASSA